MTHDEGADRDGGRFIVRDECRDDAAAIDEVTRQAFRDHPFSRQTEHLIVRGLRESGALRLSMVATVQGAVVGHAAFSPVSIDGREALWCGLGPLSVLPSHQGRGIGSALVRQALRRLHDQGHAGCVVLGDPSYYTRFGFAPRPGLVYPGPPPGHFMAIVWRGAVPAGEVAYHPAFGA